jgi:phosphomannomutase
VKTLRLSGFGMRGFVGESLTPAAVMDYASAFATFLDGGRVLVGRDTRRSSPMIHAAALAGLLGAGCEVVDLGVCPAPIVQFSVPRRAAAGAIVITGGHHPMGWNAVLLIGPDGRPLDPQAGEAVLDVFHAGGFRRPPWDGLGSVREDASCGAEYFDALGRFLDVEAIRRAAFTILLDPVGGSGCAYLEPFARTVGARLVAVNAEPSGYLAREPEPRPRSARPLASIVGPLKGDAGFVFSSDMGRLALVTERGETPSEEYGFPLVAAHVLGRRIGPVVTNGCTTRTVDDVAAARGAPVIKTPVGQAYVMAALEDESGAIGGEGSGSAAVPAFSRAFDGFLMAGLVLEAMATARASLSDLLHALPRYHIVKRSVPCAPGAGYRALDAVREHAAALPGARIDTTDGLRIDRDDGWTHVRASRTEPIVRVISEAKDPAAAAARADELVRLLGQGT